MKRIIKKSKEHISIVQKLLSGEYADKIDRGLATMRRSWKAEFKNIRKDLGILSLFLGVQIFYPIVYPIPFYDGHSTVRELPVAIIDNDRSVMSRTFFRMIDANENMTIAMDSTSLEEAKRKFLEGKVNGIIVIPKHFGDDIYSNKQTSVSVYCDAGYFLIYKQVLIGVKYVSAYMSAGIQIKKLEASGLSEAAAYAARNPLPFIAYPLYNPSSSYSIYIIPVVLILILQQTLLIGVGALGGSAYERGRYHYLTSALDRKGATAAVVLGKAGVYLTLFLCHALYFFGVVFKFHDLPMKSNLLTLMIFIVPFLLAVIFLAITISTVFRTREMSILLLLFTTIPFVLLSGFSWPQICMPHWLSNLAMLVPSSAGIDGILKLTARGADFREVSGDWVFLWGLAILYFTISVWSYKTILKKQLVAGKE